MHDEKKQFLTPTINLFFNANDFVKFVLNLNYYLGLTPIPCSTPEKYPVLALDDILLYCVHYNTSEEAIRKWEERKQRINFDKVFVLMNDRNGFDEHTYSEFKKITFPKLLLTNSNDYVEDSLLIHNSKHKYTEDLSRFTFFGKRKIFKTKAKLIIKEKMEKAL